MKKALSVWVSMSIIPFLYMGVAQAQSPDASTPHPSTASPAYDRPQAPGLGKQILGGLAFGSGGLLAGGAAGAGILAASCAVWGEDCGFAGLGGALLGGILGFSAGFPYGVYRAGTDPYYDGSLTYTYASTLLGGAVGFGGAALATGLRNEDDWFLSAMLGMAGAPIGALIGFNFSRGPRNGVPQVSVAPMPDGGWAGRLVWNLR